MVGEIVKADPVFDPIVARQNARKEARSRLGGIVRYDNDRKIEEIRRIMSILQRTEAKMDDDTKGKDKSIQYYKSQIAIQDNKIGENEETRKYYEEQVERTPKETTIRYYEDQIRIQNKKIAAAEKIKQVAYEAISKLKKEIQEMTYNRKKERIVEKINDILMIIDDKDSRQEAVQMIQEKIPAFEFNKLSVWNIKITTTMTTTITTTMEIQVKQ